jgi:hypothetical protein
MTRFQKWSAVPASLIVVVLAPPAHADPDPAVGPAVGSPCAHYQMNTVTTANSGDQVRCVSVYGQGYFWMPDVGVPQQDPQIAAAGPQEQANAFAYCTQHFPRPQECHQIIYGTP